VIGMFETFLRRKASDSVLELAQISVKDFGEWAWDMCQEYEETEQFFEFYEDEAEPDYSVESFLEFADKDEYFFPYSEMAVVCLGRKEIEERLEELNPRKELGLSSKQKKKAVGLK